MAPHGETILSSTNARTKNLSNLPRLSNDNLKRTMSDFSFEWLSEEASVDESTLPVISEVEDAKCECCGMSEEYTPEYIAKFRKKHSGKWICGLCADAVKEEAEKNGGKSDEALTTHMNACSKFNKFGRAYPVLHQAEAMREMFKKNNKAVLRTKSSSPRDRTVSKKGGISRTNSCIPAITKEMNNLNIAT